ncbi:MAG: glycoside hydrolase family 88 protein, partial [Planctomycetota bacterium]
RTAWGEPAESDPGYGAKVTPPGFRRATKAEAEKLGICPWCCPCNEPGETCRLFVKDDLSAVKVRPGRDNRIQNGIWLELYRQTGDKKFLDWQAKAMETIIERDPWFEKKPGFQKIIDASFLPGISAPRMGAITGDKRYYANTVRRLEAFTNLLRDPKTGIFHQGWGWPSEDPEGYTPGHWGRGNGWIIGAEIETLAFLPKDDPGYGKTLALFRDLCASLAKYQDEEGMWRQLVAHPDSYPETSGTGLIVFAYAKGYRLGLLGPEYRDRAIRGFQALKKHVKPDGTVLSTCAGTGPTKVPTLAAYYARPTPKNDPHGDGPVLLAASEILRLERMEGPGGTNGQQPVPAKEPLKAKP